MTGEANFTLVNATKAKLPRLAFAQMKEAALGSDYILSVSIVSKETIRELNKKYRQIDEPTDILSFPLTAHEGEIYLNLEYAKKESKKFNRTYENFLGYLFIHGLVHLKGYDHSSKMEEIEVKLRKLFGV